MKVKKVSQSDAFVPILQTLLKFSPDGSSAMAFPEIVGASLSSMGLRLNVMGDKDGRPLVYSAFSNAGQELRNRWKFIESEKRSWKLTPKGIEIAKTGAMPVVVRAKKVVEPKAAKEPKPPKEPKAKKEKPPKEPKAKKEPKANPAPKGNGKPKAKK